MQFILLTFPFEWVSFSWKSVYLDFNVKMDWYTLFLQPHCTYITCKMRWLSKLNNMATFCTFTIIGLEDAVGIVILTSRLAYRMILWKQWENSPLCKKRKERVKMITPPCQVYMRSAGLIGIIVWEWKKKTKKIIFLRRCPSAQVMEFHIYVCLESDWQVCIQCLTSYSAAVPWNIANLLLEIRVTC